ncbi:hypothetical protein ACFOD4_04560 [Pseudoroseomonas globiformis]|uniref:Uncharacterized protein n=1 Tax=Teichococcus globiformis TaxID=2307229 RepID=A0ABV7FVC3_9PROT
MSETIPFEGAVWIIQDKAAVASIQCATLSGLSADKAMRRLWR